MFAAAHSAGGTGCIRKARDTALVSYPPAFIDAVWPWSVNEAFCKPASEAKNRQKVPGARQSAAFCRPALRRHPA